MPRGTKNLRGNPRAQQLATNLADYRALKGAPKGKQLLGNVGANLNVRRRNFLPQRARLLSGNQRLDRIRKLLARDTDKSTTSGEPATPPAPFSAGRTKRLTAQQDRLTAILKSVRKDIRTKGGLVGAKLTKEKRTAFDKAHPQGLMVPLPPKGKHPALPPSKRGPGKHAAGIGHRHGGVKENLFGRPDSSILRSGRKLHAPAGKKWIKDRHGKWVLVPKGVIR